MILGLLRQLGRHGAAFLACGLLIGIILPPLAALLRPLLSLFVFLLLVATMLAVEWRGLAAHLRRPRRVVLILAWTMIAVPLLMALVAHLAHLPPAVGLGLVLWAGAPPQTSLPAIAILLGLDPALALLAMLVGTFLLPFTLPPLVLGLLGLPLDIGMLALMRNLAGFVLGAGVAAAALRWLAGRQWLERHGVEVSGVTVLILLLFGIGIMAGVPAIVWARPGEAFLDVASAFLASLALQGLTFLVFARCDRRTALTAGLIGGSHNLAVVWAMLGPATAAAVMLFLIAVQFPVYILPASLRPLYRRLGAAAPIKD